MNDAVIESSKQRVPHELWLGRWAADFIYSDITDARRHPEKGYVYGPFPSALAMAYLGWIEDGGPTLGRTRDEIFEFVRPVLSPAEFFVVETVAVPRHIRAHSAQALENAARSDDLSTRVHAVTWLYLVGWFDSPQCTLEQNPFVRHELLLEATGDEAAVRLASDRFRVAREQYRVNGPPPLAISGSTLGRPRAGWRTITLMVPEHLAEHDGDCPAADPPSS